MGWRSQTLIQKANIIDKDTTSYNPQANAICERMHQTVGNVLRTLLHGTIVTKETKFYQIVENSLATAMHAARVAVSRALDYNLLGSLVFHRYMFLNIPLEADLLALRHKRQQRIDMNLIRHNAKRWNFDYVVGQQVLVRREKGRKMDSQTNVPFTVVQVFTNGTVAIQRQPNVVERINIRRLSPYRR